jgi:hypothetical protein
MWEYFVVVLVHLRDAEAIAPAHKEFKEAQYDVTVMTLDPEWPVPDLELLEDGGIHSGGQLVALEPAEFTAQFPDVGGDGFAYEIVEQHVRAVVEGRLIPDADYRTQWGQALAAAVWRYQSPDVQMRNKH